MVLKKFLKWNRWSSKKINEEIIKGAIIISIMVGGGKSSPYIENEISRG